jgi:hypothetical protein
MAHSAVLTADIDLRVEHQTAHHYVQNSLDTLKNFATSCFTFSYLDSLAGEVAMVFVQGDEILRRLFDFARGMIPKGYFNVEAFGH